MKLLKAVLLIASICFQNAASQSFFEGLFNFPKKPCERDPIPIFQDALHDFSMKITKRSSFYTNDHFIVSPYAVWLSLASIAEFADKSVQRNIFGALNLPEEKCIRDKLYQIALGLEVPGSDVVLQRERALAIDERAQVSEDWIAYVTPSKILSYFLAPFDLGTPGQLLDGMALRTDFELSGNSVFLDRLLYQAFWPEIFSDAVYDKAPFFDDFGKEIGGVEYMRMKKRVRLAHIPIINAKVLELPVGNEGRYSLLLTMGVRSNTVRRMMEYLRSSTIIEIIKSLTLSLIPIDVAIPKFTMTSGLDVRPVLEDLGMEAIFKDPAATRYISNPPALPSGYLQRISVNITSPTFIPRRPEPLTNPLVGFLDSAVNVASDVASAVGRDFIANRPFLFTLIDTKTNIAIFSGAYSYPDRF